MAMNVMQPNEKKISLALGAVVEMSYLWAGADKGIETEMQGKDNGETIYYRVTQLGDPTFVEDMGAADFEDDGSLALNATAIKQVTVPVKMNDSCIMYNIKAFERQVTSIGEDAASAKVGQKLGKKAVRKIIDKDVDTIGNVFVCGANDSFETFQKATSFLKSYVDGTLYGWMDWQIWGELTGKGQQAVPCALAGARFGKDLKGSWALIDQLRTVGDISVIEAPSAVVSSGVTAAANAETGTITLAGTSVSIKKGDMFTIAGVYAKDVNDMPTTKLFVFKAAADISAAGDATSKLTNAVYGLQGANGWCTPTPVTAGAVKSVLTAGKKYAACIIRADGAQAFGSMKTCDCEGAKYEKSSLDGVTIHVNSGENVKALKTDKRFDMIFASKLVEPRAAALVLYPLTIA